MDARTTTIVTFLQGLRRESGAYADTHTGEGSLGATLSALKALHELGQLTVDPQTIAYVRSCRHDNGGFSLTPDTDPAPFNTAQGLIALATLGQQDLLDEYVPAATAYMAANAATQFDHFMLIAAYEEAQLTEPVPSVSIDFFTKQLAQNLADGAVIDASIAAASLLRAGHTLPDPDPVIALMLSGQATQEGGFGAGDESSLFATYCVMRLLALLDVLPDTQRLLAYVGSLQTDFGYSDAPGHPTSAGATYMILSMMAWVHDLQRVPVEAAKRGDNAALKAWLEKGGTPNLYASDGWTVLLGAASRGRAETVKLLLDHGADPAQRYEAADALPVYMAGQAGDVETVRLLLEAAPEHLHAFSRINGHTVLLQAAFYGKTKHLELAAYLLDNAAELAGQPASELAAEQAKMLSATNVRGYSALTMQDLWHNEQMKALLLRYYEGRADTLAARRQQYYADLLLHVATPQALSEKMMLAITDYLASDDPSAADARIDAILRQPAFDIDRLAGDIRQTPLIFAITGVDVGHPARAQRRYDLAKKLLEAGADPAVVEVHPMAIGAVIRASVLNNFGLLQLIAEYMTPEDFAAEMNVSPAVNGLTAMHDAIHRALTSPPAELEGHLAQITWMIERGARLDIPDNVGQTQRELAEAAQDDPAFPKENVNAVLAAIHAAQAA